MQTPQLFIADQVVSAKAYQRLAETLLQQQAIFESVVTEQPTPSSPAEEKVAYNPAIYDLSIRFVLMRSPALNVLLLAYPLAHSTATHREPIESARYRINLTFDSEAVTDFVRCLHSDQPVSKAKIKDFFLTLENSGKSSEYLRVNAHKSANRSHAGGPESAAFVLAWAKHLATSPEGDTQLDSSENLSQAKRLTQRKVIT